MADELKVIREFCADYQRWLNDGAPQGAPYYRRFGLCVSLYDYCHIRELVPKPYLEYLHEMFVADGLDESLPFDDDEAAFKTDAWLGICHLNVKRKQWVIKQLIKEPQ